MDGQLVQQDFVVSLEEVVEVFELFVLFRRKLLELVLHLLRNLILINCCLIKWQHLLFLSFESAAQFSSLQYLFSQRQIFLQLLNGIPRVVGKFLQPSLFFLSETIHLLFEFLIIPRNILLLFFQGIVARPTFLLMLKDLQLEQINFGLLDIALPCQIVDIFRHLLILVESFLVLFCPFSGVGLIFLVHLLQLGVVFGLFGLQVEF